MRCCYFAGDVEASIGVLLPPLSNTLSFALVEVGNPENFFYAEVRPLRPENWNPATEKIHRMSREYLLAYGEDPRTAFERSARWVRKTAGDRVPVYCAQPVRFDYGHMSANYRQFGIRNPFRLTLDCRTHFRLIFGIPGWKWVRARRIKRVFPAATPHLHHALADSFELEERVAAMLKRLDPFARRG